MSINFNLLNPYELVNHIVTEYGINVIDVKPIGYENTYPMYVLTTPDKMNNIYVNNNVITPEVISARPEIVKTLLLHELGHILDYRQSKVKFRLKQITSLLRLRLIMKKVIAQGKHTDDTLQAYYNTPIEKSANKHFNLTYKDFI